MKVQKNVLVEQKYHLFFYHNLPSDSVRVNVFFCYALSPDGTCLQNFSKIPNILEISIFRPTVLERKKILKIFLLPCFSLHPPIRRQGRTVETSQNLISPVFFYYTLPLAEREKTRKKKNNTSLWLIWGKGVLYPGCWLKIVFVFVLFWTHQCTYMYIQETKFYGHQLYFTRLFAEKTS